MFSHTSRYRRVDTGSSAQSGCSDLVLLGCEWPKDPCQFLKSHSGGFLHFAYSPSVTAEFYLNKYTC